MVFTVTVEFCPTCQSKWQKKWYGDAEDKFQGLVETKLLKINKQGLKRANAQYCPYADLEANDSQGIGHWIRLYGSHPSRTSQLLAAEDKLIREWDAKPWWKKILRDRKSMFGGELDF